MNSIASQIADRCRTCLTIDEASLQPEYRYHSLPLCVIDAVFSIGVTYESTRNTIRRFCQHLELTAHADEWMPHPDEQLPIDALLDLYHRHGVEYVTAEIYGNRQRTSTRNGILKGEAVLRFAMVLQCYGVQYLQDVASVREKKEFERDVRSIPGQRSSVSLRYFYMLTGSDDYIKPDRMIDRFIYDATGKRFDVAGMHEAIRSAHQLLAADFPQLTLRRLDGLIWQYQRNQ